MTDASSDAGTDSELMEAAARLGSLHVFNHFINGIRLTDPEREAEALALRKRFYCSGIWLLGLDVMGTHIHAVTHNPGRMLTPEQVAARMDEVYPEFDKKGQRVPHNPNSAICVTWAASSNVLGSVIGSWKQSFTQRYNIKNKTYGTAFRQKYQWRLVTEDEAPPDKPSQIQDPSGSLLNVYTYAEGNGVAGGLADSAVTDVGSGQHFWEKHQTPPFPLAVAREVARLFLPQEQIPPLLKDLLDKLRLHLLDAVNRRSVRDQLEFEIKKRGYAHNSDEARALEDEVRRFFDEALCLGNETAVKAFADRLAATKHPRLSQQIRSLSLGDMTMFAVYRRRRVAHLT
jgi:hypothetical protein